LWVTSAPVPSGLVAAYNFNAGSGTTVSDTSGLNNTGTISGATWTTSGKFGSALSFDGVNDLVSIPDAALLDLTTQITLMAWVYPAVSSGWRTVLLKEQPGNLAYALYSSANNNRPSAWLYIGGQKALDGPAVLPANTWSHLATTYNGTTQRLYVNGVQVASQARTGATTVSAGALKIGGNTIWNEWFQGRIDEVRIYNVALTATRIQAVMNTPYPRSLHETLLTPKSFLFSRNLSPRARLSRAWGCFASLRHIRKIPPCYTDTKPTSPLV
jgi:hypothetical protein